MNKTKKKILGKALEIYNREGISNVSIRQLAKDVGMSHSNLIYHYPTQEDVILALHELFLQEAIELNRGIIKDKSPLKSLYEATKAGFSVVYDFRFFFNELHYICNTYPRIKEVMRNVEEVRSDMYKIVIQEMMDLGLLREEEFENEYDGLIIRIKIFSDHWLESSSIYDEISKEDKINRYAHLLLQHFYPYLTKKGKDEFKKLQTIKPKKIKTRK